MNGSNIAVVRGVVSSDPRRRELRSGVVVTNLDVTTQLDHARCSVPVVVTDRPVTVAVGDEVVVCGTVVRRFFRANGATVSRTEVVAERVVPVRQTRRVRQLLDAAAAAISDSG